MKNTAPDTYDPVEFNRIIKDFDDRLTDLEMAINAKPFVVLNVGDATRLRTFDVNTATVAELRRVLGTLIVDFQKKGRLS